jgi:hypothetical protein
MAWKLDGRGRNFGTKNRGFRGRCAGRFSIPKVSTKKIFRPRASFAD